MLEVSFYEGNVTIESCKLRRDLDSFIAYIKYCDFSHIFN